MPPFLLFFFPSLIPSYNRKFAAKYRQICDPIESYYEIFVLRSQIDLYRNLRVTKIYAVSRRFSDQMHTQTDRSAENLFRDEEPLALRGHNSGRCAMKFENKISGFTLIEAMVSITVVAVMAATAIPSVRAVIMRGRLIQLTALQAEIRTAVEAGMGDLEQKGTAGLEDTLNFGWSSVVYAYVNRQGSSNANVLKAFAPGINSGMFRPHQHAYMIWGTECYLNNNFAAEGGGGGCMAWASLAIDCQYHIMDGFILWKNTNTGENTSGNVDVVVRYRQPFDDATSPAVGCQDGEMNTALIENVFDLTPEDGKDVGAIDADKVDKEEPVDPPKDGK